MDKKEKRAVKKTYGVSGLVEWHARFPVYATTVEAVFTGGTVTGFGVAPARYATADPTMQRIIEESHWFKIGKIFLC